MDLLQGLLRIELFQFQNDEIAIEVQVIDTIKPRTVTTMPVNG